MLKKIIQFIKYHNAFVIGLIFVLGASGVIFASDTIREATIGKAVVEQQGIDNSALLTVDLDNFDFAMTITGVTEDAQNYYVSYTYQTLAISDNVWQEISRAETLTVSKSALGGRDLGLYVAEELGEIIDSELAYLAEVQTAEEQKGQTFVQETTKYTGLIGLVLNPVTKQLPGYTPVVKPPEPAPVVYIEPEPQLQPAPEPLVEPQPESQPEPLSEPQSEPATTTSEITATTTLVATTTTEVATTTEATTTETVTATTTETTTTTTEAQATTTETIIETATSSEATTTEPVCEPSEEICDGIDNNCDGQIDENLFQQCGSTDIGACQFGSQTCGAGVWSECQGAIEPIEEMCGDNLDNNCDGQADENCSTNSTTTTATTTTF